MIINYQIGKTKKDKYIKYIIEKLHLKIDDNSLQSL